MSKTCGCGECEYLANGMGEYDFVSWFISVPYDSGYCSESYPVYFCPHCGDKLLPDGTVESRAEVDKVLGHFLCGGCLHEKQSDHYEPCTYCKRKYEDEYTRIKQEATK